MKKTILVFVIVSMFGVSCEEPCVRVGAKCKDGTTSTATGSGACSGHGGVKEWICQ
ncbi:MAG: hypothetical protein JNL53_17340 [Cyclobacteriaceae bacterium]|nr:hypothetical protein [Cyclobacteriaceae bacterium]